MKKCLAISILLFFLYHFLSAQSDENILPKSYLLPIKLTALPEFILPSFPYSEILEMDSYNIKNGSSPAVARDIQFTINPHTADNWTILPDGGRIWRVKITSPGALGLAPMFDTLYLPAGATLHIYTPNQEEILGAFSNANTPQPRPFCPGIINGENCILEYYEPVSQKGNGIIHINMVGHVFRNIEHLHIENGRSYACEVNVACPEGDSVPNQIHSVVRIFITYTHNDSSWNRFCSGALINNLRQDSTPYILSAQHCTLDTVTDAQYNLWNFLFDFQADSCNGISAPTNHVINGCKRIADSHDDGGNTGSDFLLLELKLRPTFTTFYSGWNLSASAPDSGVCIHHPDADIKKISTYITPPVSSSWGGNILNTHWRVTWATTVSGHGVTEPGSSGSPLYNQDGLIVGQLTGGSSCCFADGCGTGTGPDQADLFGKLAFDWTSNGADSSYQLKPWLDPDNTGATSLNGLSFSPVSGIINPPNDELNLNVMPNPSAGIFNISFDKNEEKTIRIFDGLGRLVFTKNAIGRNVQIDLTAKSKGIYMLEVKTIRQKAVTKIMVE